MKRILDFLKKYLLILFFGLILSAGLLSYYRGGRIISGGEGSYFLDFSLLWKNYMATWLNAGTGIFATSLNFAFLPHLIIFQKIVQNERAVNFLAIFLIYFLPFLAVYLLCLELKLKPLLSFLMALFYLSNPFIISFLKSINQWNMLAAYIIPSFFLIILKFYRRNLLLFFFFGLHSLFFAFTNANPPTMALYQVAIPFFILLVSIYKEEKFDFSQIIKSYLVVFSSFFLFNFWWIINWFFIFTDASSGYTKQFAISWLRGSGKFTPEWWRVINLESLFYPPDPAYDFFGWLYSRTLVPIILLIPFLILFYLLLQGRLNKKHHYLLALMMVVFSFLAKGVNGLFSGIYEFMVMKIPLFSIFKSAGEKWGILMVFFLTLFLVFGLRELKKIKYGKIVLILLVIYVSYSTFAFTGDFIPDYRTINLMTGSRRFLYKSEYKDVRKELNNDLENYRVLSLPGSSNYQVALQIEGKKFYTGNDPILNNTNKPFLAPYNGTFDQRFGFLFEKISQSDYLNFLGLFNIKKIVINKDMFPWFGFQEKESVPEMEEIFDRNLKSVKNSVIDLYDTGDYYLPRFYVPEKVFYLANAYLSDLATVIGLPDFTKRTAAFFKPENITHPAWQNKINLAEEKSFEKLVVGDIHSTFNEAKLRMGNEQMNPGGVMFPYARWKPGSFFYFYIIKKEERVKNQFANNPEALIEQYLFFAAKRIYEIQKWGKQLKDQQFSEVLEQYRKEMEQAIELLSLLNRESKKDNFPLLLKIEVSFSAHFQRLLDVMRGDYQEGKNKRVELAQSILEKIDGQLKDVIGKGFSQTRYHFVIPQEGEYEVLGKHEKISPEIKLENATVDGIDRFTLQPLLPLKNNSWTSFGKRYFKKGELYLTFAGLPAENLLEKNLEDIDQKMKMDDQIKLPGDNKSLTFSTEIADWKSGETYKFSFKYKTNGGKLRVLLVEKVEEKTTSIWAARNVDVTPQRFNSLIDRTIESGDDWASIYGSLTASYGAKSVILVFLNTSVIEMPIDIFLKEIKLEPITEPQLVLRKVEDYQKTVIGPKITFKKVNNTKYLIDIQDASDPYLLVFSESFHRGWKAYINKIKNSDGEIVGSYFNGEIKEKESENVFLNGDTFETWGKQPLPETKHLVVNGYANSWYITPQDANKEGNYQIIVEYWPQKLFIAGLAVSLMIILGTFSLVVVGLTKRQKNLKC